MKEPKVVGTYKTEDEQIKHDEVDRLNKDRLVALMLEHGITIPARELDQWRPTVEQTGRIEGVSDGLKCILTNGLLGYFIRGDREPLYGHMHHFKWDVEGDQQVERSGVPPTFYRTGGAKPPKKTRKPRAVITTAQALAIVERTLAKHAIK